MDESRMTQELEKLEREYNKLGLKWTMGSIRYLVGRGYEGLTKTFNSLRIPDPINTLGLVECAVQDKKKADEIVNEWVSNGNGLTLLHLFMVEALKDQGFFKTEQEMELIMHLTAQKETLKDMGTQILTDEMREQILTVQNMMQ